MTEGIEVSKGLLNKLSKYEDELVKLAEKKVSFMTKRRVLLKNPRLTRMLLAIAVDIKLSEDADEEVSDSDAEEGEPVAAAAAQ